MIAKHCRHHVFVKHTPVLVGKNARRIMPPLRLSNSDFAKTNVLSDYIDKTYTDVNYVSYIEEDGDEGAAVLQVCIIVAVLVYMFWASKPKA